MAVTLDRDGHLYETNDSGLADAPDTLLARANRPRRRPTTPSLSHMKAVGALTLVVGTIAGVLLCLVPTNVNVLGTDVDCGTPARGVFGYDESEGNVISLDGEPSDTAQQCQRQSIIRVVIAGFVGLAGFVAGLLMLLLSPSREDRERERFDQWQRWQREQQSRQGPPPPHA